MIPIHTYTVRYAFHLDGARKEMVSTREGVSPLRLCKIESAELSDLFDLPRVHLLTADGAAFAQIGHDTGMYVVMVVEGER